MARRDEPPRQEAAEAGRNYQALLDAVLEGSQLGIWDWNLTTGEVQRSARMATMLGFAPDEIAATLQGWKDLLHPDDREATIRASEDFAAGRTPVFRTEYRLRAKDGSYRWLQDLAAAVERDAGGRPLRAFGTLDDITARKQAADELQESERKYRLLFETSLDALMILAPPDWRFVEGNPSAVAMFRARDEAEFTSRAPWQLSPPTQPDGRPSAQAAKQRIEQALRAGGNRFDWLHQRLDGERFEATVVLTPFEWKGETLLQATVRDVSERRHAEQEYRTILEAAIDGFWIIDAQGRLLEVNDAFCELIGYGRDELLEMGIVDLEVVESPEETERRLEKIAAQGFDRFETRQRRKDGRIIDVEVSARFLPLRGGIFVVFLQDISARKQLEQDRLEARKRLEEQVAERTTSLARTMQEMRESRLAALNMMRDAVEAKRRLEAANADLIHEVQERKRIEQEKAVAEQQLVQALKIEAIGRLAGGIAHDFNNLLGVIAGYGKLAQDELPTGHPARAGLDQVLDAAQRASDLTRQLLAFSRKQVLRAQVVDLNAVLADLETMLRPLLGEDIELVVKLAPDLDRVLVDPAQMQQVVMNLAVNARDAMPRGGRLILETANTEFAHDYAATHPPAVTGRFVMLAVSDTGVGMDEETQRRCFDPFFTTKPEGQGTGLGLAMTYGIVKQSGGYVWVYSEPGRGTTIKAYLPRTEESAELAPAPKSSERVTGGSETVLVVEDMEALRGIIRRVLDLAGYVVLEAADGRSALEIARAHTGRIDLLLTDVVMPGLGGAEVARQMRELQPETRVLFMSGYTEGAISEHGLLADDVSLLDKPFTNDVLKRAVRRALDRPKPG